MQDTRRAAIACDAECDSEHCLLILIEVRPLISMIAMSDGVFRTDAKVLILQPRKAVSFVQGPRMGEKVKTEIKLRQTSDSF